MGKCRVTECWTYRSIDRAVYKPDAVSEPGREFGLQVRSAAVAWRGAALYAGSSMGIEQAAPENHLSRGFVPS